MKVKNLLSGVSYTLLQGDLNQEVDNVIYDSRVKTKQGVFIAVEGFKQDGHKYIESAIENGAKTIVVQKTVSDIPEGITVIQVEDTRKVMADLANTFYDFPSKKLDVVGVTGTNGKTSITFLLGQILEAYHKKIGIIGTIENRIGQKILKAERTTPESPDLQRLLDQMAKEGMSHCLMEVASHALALHRVDGTKYKVGIFTNLTQDHLDFHHTMENYGLAKAKLFKMCEVGLVNNDSPYVELMTKEAACKLITYGIDKDADYRALNLKNTAAGISYTLVTPEGTFEVQVPIPGKFTAYNTLAVIGAARILEMPMAHILETLRTVKGVPGRIQTINSPKGYSVIVDYAHTPDGLENVLQAAKQFTENKLICVFGCGGDRDQTKRPLMGAVAAKYSDYVIITSDNPRTEDPYTILDQVEVGVQKGTQAYTKIEDREKAIHYALENAQKGDVIIIAGKGHETYQILKDRIIHFDDSEVVEKWLQEEKTCN